MQNFQLDNSFLGTSALINVHFKEPLEEYFPGSKLFRFRAVSFKSRVSGAPKINPPDDVHVKYSVVVRGGMLSCVLPK
jgi:hypothetical protein